MWEKKGEGEREGEHEDEEGGGREKRNSTERNYNGYWTNFHCEFSRKTMFPSASPDTISSPLNDIPHGPLRGSCTQYTQ